MKESSRAMTFQLDPNNSEQAHTAERLRTTEILWLASVRPDGRPHLVPVWFFWEGETILIFSQPHNQKIRNLRQNPAVTVSLDGTDRGNDIIALEGVAALLDDPTITSALPAYAAKYTELLADMGSTPEMMAKEYSQTIRITITRQLSI
ncbi:MAG TPA: TIGR03667 family PPOX class F420-dependent oxidoreductase [Ktedonobacterales bacterium]